MNKYKMVPAPGILLGLLTFVLHLIANNHYGVFSDELYFIVCGQHPAWGYVDQPPLVPLIAATSHTLFGMALLPLRLLPALAMAATVALTVDLSGQLGGNRFAQWLSGLAVMLGSVYLVDGLLLTTDFLQPLTWLGCSWCVIRLILSRDERWWLGVGAIAGISLTSKYLILFYLAALAIGVLATPMRRSLLRPWFYVGALVALVCVTPSLAWQASHGWPFIELGRNAVSHKNAVLSPLGFLAQQILFVGPLAAPIWIAGLWFWSVKPPLPEFRIFPIAYAAMIVLFYLLHGKAYYLAPIYPVLLAGGAVAIENWLKNPVWRGLAIGAVASTGVVLAPLALPLLPPDQYGGYARMLGIRGSAATTEKGAQSSLPLHLAGMFGWREMAEKIAEIYRALPPDQRARAVFYGRDYGEASAVILYGQPIGGPPAISGHNNYFFWGPGNADGSVMIVLGNDVVPLMRNYQSVTLAGRIENRYAEAFETNLPIYILRQPRVPLSTLWPRLKYFE
jgi:hypothetical protein